MESSNIIIAFQTKLKTYEINNVLVSLGLDHFHNGSDLAHGIHE